MKDKFCQDIGFLNATADKLLDLCELTFSQAET